ncbi:MAG: archaetidylserine decarboxylase [Candidatus Sericytochromatia bacterium]
MEKISLYNRETKEIEEEIVSLKSVMDFMYNTKTGLLLTEKILKKKYFSLVYGNTLKKPSSKKRIYSFIKQHNIDIAEIEKPLDSFNSFNEFFIRKLKPVARPVEMKANILISPADSRLSVYPIQEDTIIPVKGLTFKLAELINDENLAKKYINGLCLVFRLAPADYHRFCFIDDGEQTKITPIGEHYHSVHPIALQSNLPIFKENYREMCEIKTKHFGDILDIDVGALGVSKIVQNYPEGYTCKRGEEKGYFEFGGSTTILIFQKNRVRIDDDIKEYSQKMIETKVKYGSRIGIAIY